MWHSRQEKKVVGLLTEDETASKQTNKQEIRSAISKYKILWKKGFSLIWLWLLTVMMAERPPGDFKDNWPSEGLHISV